MASAGAPDILEDTKELLFVSKQDGSITSYGGWKTELLVEDIISASEKKLLVCTLCKGMLRDACAVRLDGKKQARCSACVSPDLLNEAISSADLIRSVVDDRMLHCPFISEGCKWSGTILEISLHFEDCQYISVPCPLGCFVLNSMNPKVILKIQRKSVEDHVTQSCLMRYIPCEYCSSITQASNINSHFAICLEFPIQCMNKCTYQSLEDKVFVATRRMVRKHLENDCPLKQVMCPYSKYGCKSLIVRKDLQAHKLEFMEQHLQMVESLVTKLTIENQRQLQPIQNETYFDFLEGKAKEIQVKWESREKEIDMFKKMNGIIMWQFDCSRNSFHMNAELHTSSAFSQGYKFAGFIKFDKSHNMGIYFYFMNGKFDNQLIWPLTCRIIFSLHGSSNTFTRTLYSENYPDNKCFNRPYSDRGFHIGFDKFISQRDAISRGFCTNEYIFLEVALISQYCFYDF